MKSNKLFYMAGTEETGEYVVIVATEIGRIGYRDLGNGAFRVRVEPKNGKAEEVATILTEWKQPDDDGCRFSSVVGGEHGSSLGEAVKKGLTALIDDASMLIMMNKNAPHWAKGLVAERKAEILKAKLGKSGGDASGALLDKPEGNSVIVSDSGNSFESEAEQLARELKKRAITTKTKKDNPDWRI